MSLEGAFPIENSSVYQRWLAEKRAIEVHKWLISEQLGKDCGWDYALWNWTWTKRDAWLQEQKGLAEGLAGAAHTGEHHPT